MKVTVRLYGSILEETLPLLEGKIDNVIFYGTPHTYIANIIHDHGFKAIYACDALRACETWSLYNGYKNVTLQSNWAQHDNSSVVYPDGWMVEMASGSHEWETWFAPLGPFTYRVTIPRVNKAIDSDFDGIFLMSYNLYRDSEAVSGGACDNPEYTLPLQQSIYHCVEEWQSFREQQLKDMASRVSQTARGSGLEVWFSDDNIYIRPWSQVEYMKERFAVNLNGMQPFLDDYVFEWIGLIENNAKNNGTTYQFEIDSATEAVNTARNKDKLTKPATLIAMTRRKDVYVYLMRQAERNGFDVWTDWRVLL